MEYRCQSADPNAYLAPSAWIDYRHPAVSDVARRLAATAATGREHMEQAYLFVRDEVSHSGDLPPADRRVARTASEALVLRQGLCYAKSLVLAALLRWRGIPCGLCYQLLGNGEPTLHGLNAVYLPDESRWVRLDARGPGRPDFSLRDDVLYYVPDPVKGEVDYPVVYPDPDRAVAAALAAHDDFDSLSGNLPGSLSGFHS